VTSSNPQFASNSPGNRPVYGMASSRLSEKLTPTLMAVVSAIYILITLGWSASGRNDLSNARAASFAAVVAFSISFAISIISYQMARGFQAKLGWAFVAVGIGSSSAIQLASFNVLISDKIDLWRPKFFTPMWSIGAIAIAAGLIILVTRTDEPFPSAAALCGLATNALATVAGVVLLLHLVTAAELTRWELFAPVIGLASLVSITAIAWSNFRCAERGQQLQFCGLLLFAMIVLLVSTFELFGFWSDSPGIVALGRWIAPISIIGIAAFAFGHSSAPIDTSSGKAVSQRWPFASGSTSWISAVTLATGAIALLIANSELGPDVAVIGAFSFALLATRQAILLRTKHAEVEELLLSSEELQRIANIDILTGLPNRAALDQRLSEEYERAFRYEQPLSILFADIDRFKTVNDTLGHAVGDRLLQEIASRLRSTARSIDFVARYGGEEFIVVAPGTWSADALILAERLRTAVEKIEDPVYSVLGGTTISIGIAGYPEHAGELALLLERADKALYRAKTTGRNRVVLYGQETDPEV